MGKTNFSDLVRNYISDIYQRDPTYFSSKTVTERNNDFKIYCELNKSSGLLFKNHRPILSQELLKQKDLLKLKTDTSKVKSKTEKFTVTKTKQKGNITVNPTSTTPETATSETTQTQSTGLQIVKNDGTQINQIVPHPIGCKCTDCQIKRGEIQPLDPEEAGGILEIFIDFWHSRNPDVELMTDAEVVRVGKRLAPILQKHVGGDILLYGLGLVVVGQVIMKRVDQSKKSKKKDKVNEKAKSANEKTSGDEPTEKEQKKNGKEIVKSRKFFSTKKLKEIEDMGDNDD